MPSVSQIMKQLRQSGSEQTRKIFTRHGADPERLLGVKIGDMKPMAKKIKGQQELAYQLYDTGIYDAMYLAGMVADGSQMTKTLLNQWARQADWYMIAEYSVPGVATENKHAQALALKWIKAKKEHVASCGWATYAGLVATRSDEDLDLSEIRDLLSQIVDQIDQSKNRIRYAMNGFVISVGAYVKPFLKQAKSAAKKIGKLEINMGQTSCKTPVAIDYIAKIENMGRVGKKRKTIKC